MLFVQILLIMLVCPLDTAQSVNGKLGLSDIRDKILTISVRQLESFPYSFEE